MFIRAPSAHTQAGEDVSNSVGGIFMQPMNSLTPFTADNEFYEDTIRCSGLGVRVFPIFWIPRILNAAFHPLFCVVDSLAALLLCSGTHCEGCDTRKNSRIIRRRSNLASRPDKHLRPTPSASGEDSKTTESH